nr:potassium/sodium hyperpolarization-activated cyclic nucleotide-gated channel 1 [Helicoverpa armigera]
MARELRIRDTFARCGRTLIHIVLSIVSSQRAVCPCSVQFSAPQRVSAISSRAHQGQSQPGLKDLRGKLGLLSLYCFYNSTHAMRIERFKHFRKYKSRIHPMSKFRNFWDCLILHVFIINKILFRFTSTFIYDDLSIGLFYLGAFLELIIIVDLYVTLKTGYINHETKRVVLDAERCLVNFCKTKLFIHYVSAIPLHWFLLLKYGSNVSCGLCKANKFVSVLKIISIFSLYRMYETSEYYVERHGDNKPIFMRFLRIAVVSFTTLCQFYDLSEVIDILVFITEGSVPQTSLLGRRICYKYNQMSQKYGPNSMHVAFDVSRICNPSLLFRLGFKDKMHYLDQFAALIGYILNKGCYFWFLLKSFEVISHIVYPKDALMRLKKRALTMLNNQQISDDVCDKVKQYFHFRPTQLKSVELNNELLKMLPEELKKEVKLGRHFQVILRMLFFCELSVPLLQEVSQMLEERVFLRNDTVSEARSQSEGLVIIDNGVLAVYSETHKEQGHLIDGDYFGALSLVTDKELCMSFVVAITTCNVMDPRIYFNNEKNAFVSELFNYSGTQCNTTLSRYALIGF